MVGKAIVSRRALACVAMFVVLAFSTERFTSAFVSPRLGSFHSLVTPNLGRDGAVVIAASSRSTIELDRNEDFYGGSSTPLFDYDDASERNMNSGSGYVNPFGYSPYLTRAFRGNVDNPDDDSENEDGYDTTFGRGSFRKKRWWRKALSAPFRYAKRITAKPRRPGTLILVRHGESLWNANKTFTGWADPDLSAKGHREVEHAARLVLENGYEIDVVFTSRLTRAIRSAWILLQELNMVHLPVFKSWRLNERMYGALTGLSKKETAEQLGTEIVQKWRGSYKSRPPPLKTTDPHWPGKDRRHADLAPHQIPLTESLQDCMARTAPLWNDKISEELNQGRNVMVVAHANTLRGLVKIIDDVGDREIQEVAIPTGIPIVYTFERANKPNVNNNNILSSKTKKMARKGTTRLVPIPPSDDETWIGQVHMSGVFLEKPGLLKEALKKEALWSDHVPGYDSTMRRTIVPSTPMERSLFKLKAERELGTWAGKLLIDGQEEGVEWEAEEDDDDGNDGNMGRPIQLMERSKTNTSAVTTDKEQPTMRKSAKPILLEEDDNDKDKTVKPILLEEDDNDKDKTAKPILLEENEDCNAKENTAKPVLLEENEDGDDNDKNVRKVQANIVNGLCVTPASLAEAPIRKDATIVIIRHGKTDNNKLGLFTGWDDVPLAQDGIDEAIEAGRLLKKHGFEFDVVYTSWLSRAIETAWHVMDELDCIWLPIIKSWRLNERMYGSLTGLSKRMVAQRHGRSQFMAWRRGYKVRPPKVDSFSPLYPGNDKRYRHHLKDVRISLRETLIRSIEGGKFVISRKLPKAESLKDCMDRTIPYFAYQIVPEAINQGKRVLIASSENAIRGLLMHLCEIPEDKITQLEIPNGLPLIFDVRSRCVKLLDDGSGVDPLEKYNFGEAAPYLFRPCRNEDGLPDEECDIRFLGDGGITGEGLDGITFLRPTISPRVEEETKSVETTKNENMTVSV